MALWCVQFGEARPIPARLIAEPDTDAPGDQPERCEVPRRKADEIIGVSPLWRHDPWYVRDINPRRTPRRPLVPVPRTERSPAPPVLDTQAHRFAERRVVCGGHIEPYHSPLEHPTRLENHSEESRPMAPQTSPPPIVDLHLDPGQVARLSGSE